MKFTRRLKFVGRVLAAGLLVSSLASRAGAEDRAACAQTSRDVLRSCQVGAHSGESLALAKCDNVSHPAEQQSCRRRAAQALSAALQECLDGFAARQAVCAMLGQAPYDPVIDPANFVAGIDNPYFPLVPGTTFVYEGQTEEGFEHVDFIVTHNTRVILGVTCIEVHDVVTLDGVLSEDTLDWFAQDRDGTVWYFGENTHELVDGLITTIAGTFMAGVAGDKPGVIMKAHPAVGDFYRQEFSLANAEDLAETLSLHQVVNVPAGSFDHCLQSQETTPLETTLLEHKFNAPGVGNVLTVDVNTGSRVELIEIRTE